MHVTYVTSHVDVPKNSGTPQWMVKITENLLKMDSLGEKTLCFGNTHVKITQFFLNSQTPKVFPRGLGPLIEGPGRRAGGYSGPDDPVTAGGTVEVDRLLGVLNGVFHSFLMVVLWVDVVVLLCYSIYIYMYFYIHNSVVVSC